MDRNYIDSELIVERYMSGELTVKEAREFEKFCLEHPDVLREMPIPVRLKARLAKRPLEDSETGMFAAIPSSATHAALQAHEEGVDEEEEEEWRRSQGADRRSRVLTIGLMVALIAAVCGAVVYGFQAHSLNQKLRQTQRQMQATAMEAPAGLQKYSVQLARSKPQQPTLALGWLQPAQLLDLYVDVGQGRYNAYQVTIDKPDGTRIMQIGRIGRDSNRELRLALNSSAFGPGEYLLRFDGYNWRGQTEEVGWIRLGLE